MFATWAVPRTLILALAAASCASALHLYLDAGETRCFIEELPNETVVEGHYRALEWNEKDQVYAINPELGILTEITEMDTGHVVTSTRGPPDSRWTFTSHDSGDHSICMSTNYSSSWFGPAAHIRLYIDIVVGNTRPDIEHDRGHISELASKIRDLNLKLEDIRREQQYQRERESDFRDLSELLNGRAVWYSLAQIAVLVLTCAWQLRHLRNFFEDKRNH